VGLSKKAMAIALAGVLIGAAAISPALGGPSLKKLVKTEVTKQLRNKQGPAGPAGPSGTSFDANATLPSGQTLTGVWILTAGAGSVGNELISFVPHLPGDLGPGSVHRNTGGSTTDCPGPGAAAAGHFCLYERISTLSSFSGIFNPATGGAGADRRGAQVSYTGPTGSAAGTWAVTAP
jgi:hypothetical protein